MPEKMPDVLLTGDSPTNPMIPDEDNSDPVFNHEEIPGQDWVKVPVDQQLSDAMEDIAPGELQATSGVREGFVEDTTNPPMGVMMEVVGVPFRGDTLKDTLKDLDAVGRWYGGRAGDTAVSPITLSDVGKGRDETGDTVFPSIMFSDVDKVTSPATSTPGSTPSPTRRRDELLKDSELQDSEMSVIDSSMKEKEDDKEIEVIGESATLDGKSVEEESQDAYDSSWEAIEEK